MTTAAPKAAPRGSLLRLQSGPEAKEIQCEQRRQSPSLLFVLRRRTVALAKRATSALNVAARPNEATTTHANPRVSARTAMVSNRRNELPRKISSTPREIRMGWRVRSKSRSLLLTGRVSKYSKTENTSNTPAAAPKLHRQTISANPNDGERRGGPKAFERGRALLHVRQDSAAWVNASAGGGLIASHAAILTSLPGTTITLTTSLPGDCRFDLVIGQSAFAESCHPPEPAGTTMRPRNLPFICTGISISSSFAKRRRT